MNKTKMLEYVKSKKIESKAFRNFARAFSNQNTLALYTYWLKDHFMPFAVKMKVIDSQDDYDQLTKLDQDAITDFLTDWIDHERDRGLKGRAIASKLASIEAFFEMNRKLWHKKLVRRFIPKDQSEAGGKEPITDDDIKLMLTVSTNIRTKALILFLASTGIRPYALMDPVLKLKHLVAMPHPEHNLAIPKYCYAVKVYDDSKEGYWTFLTPECTKMLDKYLQSRRINGKILTEESPLFATCKSVTRKYDHLTDLAARELIKRAMKKAGVQRIKKGNRYDKAVIYGFRKRFNTKLKLQNSVNSNVAEKLMAHKRGLDGTYLQPTREECYTEFVKAIPVLTIDDSDRIEAEQINLEHERNEVEKQRITNEELVKRIEDLEYGQEARGAHYAKEILQAETEMEKILSNIFPLVFELGHDEKYKREFWKELITSQKENRRMNQAAYDPNYVEPSEEEKRELHEYALKRLRELEKQKPLEKEIEIVQHTGKLPTKLPKYREERALKDMLLS